MKPKTKIVALFLVIILVLTGFITYFELLPEEIELDDEQSPKVIDDRISPYTNQGLTVEIKRIRNRGLMEKMLVLGASWRDKPTFYWICTVDGRIHDTAQIESAGGVVASGAFTEWDTFGKDSKGNFYVEEEQETSEVTIAIMEEVKSGLLGRNTETIEKQTIKVTYDFRTGRWSGDDFLKDYDGYGHYLGEEYEIWFNIYQSDYDHDTIPYWAEVNLLGTNPFEDDSKNDPDNDGIPTTWEYKWGYDPFTFDNHKALDPDIDGLENIEEYIMQKYFADPYHQDIYIEVDGMQKGGFFDWDHVSYEETHQMLIERFAQHNINVYIDYGWPDGPVNGGGELLDYMKVNDDTVGHFHNRFYEHNFADERKGIFRYCMVAANAGFISQGDFNHYDHIVVDSSPYVTIKRRAWTPRYRRVMLAKGILHELGHSLGLMPTTFYGIDILSNDQENRWPTQLTAEQYDNYCEQYYSVMNYDYIFGKNKKFFDYSDGSNGPTYDQNDWDHIYLPAFQTDSAAYEESQPTIDKTMEDQEVVRENQELELSGYTYDKNLTEKYTNELSTLTYISNIDCNYMIYFKNYSEDEKDVLVYAKPKVDPTVALWTLVAEGMLNLEKNKIDW